MMEGASIPEYNYVRELTENAVNASLMKITNNVRKMKVLEVLPQLEIGYKSIIGLKAVKGLNTEQESFLDKTEGEIVRNLRKLKSKLGSPMTAADVPLYSALKESLSSIEPSDLTWKDPEASMVISDKSVLVKNLKQRQKRIFLEPRENIKCDLPNSVASRCDDFVNSFNKTYNPDVLRNIIHDKKWKEGVPQLIERTNHILSTIGELWNNPAFASSEMRSNQSEGTYITDIIVPLLRASLGSLPNGNICLSTAERQSIASKERRSFGKNKEQVSQSSRSRQGKKPDIMVMTKHEGKIFELAYVESSRVICTDTKKTSDSVKLWRETLDGINFVGATCRPTNNQFGIVGIQVAGEDLYLNTLIKDASGIPRYFHIDHAEIPFTKNTPWRVKSLIRLLLTFRNIMIINKSLLIHALEQASTHPPRNVNPTLTVSTPPYTK